MCSYHVTDAEKPNDRHFKEFFGFLRAQRKAFS